MTKKEIKEKLQAQGFSREEARLYIKIAQREVEMFEGALALKRLRELHFRKKRKRNGIS